MESVSRGLRRGEAEFSIVVRQILCLINFSPQCVFQYVEKVIAVKGYAVIVVEDGAAEDEARAVAGGETADRKSVV